MSNLVTRSILNIGIHANFVLFHDVICYIKFLLSWVHDNIADLLAYHVHFGCQRRDIRKVRVCSYSLQPWRM